MKADLREQLEQSIGDAYDLERELPRGGMSRVFAAKEKALGRQVVIKVLAPELAATLSAERFKREITLAARLQHPHIVPLLSAGHAAGSLYFTMPLVDGESLRDRMNRERPMSIDSITRILEEVAGALDYAHSQGIVHRDIKPENIMFFHDRAVVLDFGIGKALHAATDQNANASGARITLSGTSLGTPMYVSPEQGAGDPSLDHRADIYSLGVVAYEMLCGHPPFTGRTLQTIFAAHATQAPQPIASRRTDTPDPLARIVMKCLEKAPAQRPGDAGEILRALRPASAGGRASDASPGFLSRIPIWVPWVIAAVSTGLALILALR